MNPTLTIPAQTLSALQKERNELRAIRQEVSCPFLICKVLLIHLHSYNNNGKQRSRAV